MEIQVDLMGNDNPIKDDLRSRFIEPPFSVLDTKNGNWQKRKKQWKKLGIESHLGRDAECNAKFDDDLDENGLNKYGRKPMTGVSIFDPALCELMYNWYCPEGGTILDPFAGGSVRGVVAHHLGFKYTGIDIREEQVESNVSQCKTLLSANNQPQYIAGDSNKVLKDWKVDDKNDINVTPIEKHGKIYVKRDDLFMVCGANGAKARAAHSMIKKAIDKGFKSFSTAGSRKSPQINIVAKICEHYGVKFTAHTPKGKLSDELLDAQKSGAKIIQHKAGYNSVIKARSKEWAKENNAFDVPFGMMHDNAINETAAQVQDIPKKVKRIVIAVGSGINLCGLLKGMERNNIKIPVLGIVIGAKPEKTLDKYAPENWRDMVTLKNAGLDYHDEVKDNNFHGIKTDPIYEAKCLKFLKKKDLFWIIGVRGTIAKKTVNKKFNFNSPESKSSDDFDLVFSCPPYADLEVYSDLEGDVSNKEYSEFIDIYSKIIKKSCNVLKSGGYAIFVVGDIRDKKGNYRDFISHTKKAFIDSGCHLYNEAILLQPLGTAMLRASRVFDAGKKLTKVHENVLIFRKP